MLKEKILNRQAGIITYGMTPPKSSHPAEKLAEITEKQYERLKDLDLDGLILYDVQDEAERTDEERPFPYLKALDPTLYSKSYLDHWKVPKIIYRVIGNHTKQELGDWLRLDAADDRFSVFVGTSSSQQQITMRLPEAYELSGKLNDRLMLGGVVIPERHMKKNDEHLRIKEKVDGGCKFFVSQATFNVEASKNMLSDYYYHCRENGIETVPILFNLAPCGSQKTLAFMKWLGISVPKWLENDLLHSADILDKSVTLSLKIFEELFAFGLEKGIPIGCSIESVSTRKVEIEASVQLVKDIQSLIDRKLNVHVTV
ncbi:methylenetetrahydrofolate reductase [Paenibacillus sp. LHD-117]|uniref:methylenetetrahydrofolate reductase n=1 Tax=Paenibacillus sp. LHD-117 TaxID=3071412 RepID=UPI0027DEFD47|nr:methylenetetrahydrofolate reductase [Paenibacillus sp. LHD-117]MDQ6419581.1 methylenetetrahydrofolate reductase [Paenibacillus sp. LHD-117]